MTTQTPQTKADVLDLVRSTHAVLEQAIGQLTDEQINTLTADNGWSVKDIMAHITAWERVLLRSHIEGRPYEQAVEGNESLPPLNTVDEINDWFYQQRKATPLTDVRATFQKVYQDTLAALEQMSESELLEGRSKVRPEASMLQVVAENTWEHYAEHTAMIRRLATDNKQQH